MYRSYPTLLVGFHGCTLETANILTSKKHPFKQSQNDFDWLGSGMYFWENNPERALEYASEHIKRKKLSVEPAVVGAILNLGHCLNLLEKYHLDNLKASYELLAQTMELAEQEMPENTGTADKLFRRLNRAVIEFHHDWREVNSQPSYDSVRGVFQEGGELYPGAGFEKKSHIQIAIRNPNCIKGFFWPRELDSKFDRV